MPQYILILNGTEEFEARDYQQISKYTIRFSTDPHTFPLDNCALRRVANNGSRTTVQITISSYTRYQSEIKYIAEASVE